MAFTSEQKRVSTKLLTDLVYRIPRNQRKYIWNEKNWKELLEDISFFDSKTDFQHFIGSVVLFENGEHEGLQYYDIIDGQQRIITILLLIATISQIYKESGDKDSFQGLMRFLVSTNLRNTKLCKIESEYQPSIENIIYRVINSDNSFAQIKESLNDVPDKNVLRCFEYFYNRLKSETIEKVHLIKNRILSTNYIDITATTEEDSYTIFEILNARGMALEDSELLKNHIMRYYQPNSSIDRVKQEWADYIVNRLKDGIDKFLIHYVRHRYKTPDSKISAYSIIKENTASVSIIELFEDLKKKAKYYNKIYMPVRATDGGDCSEVEFRVFKFLKSYRGELFRPLLMSLMDAMEKKQISVDLYEQFLIYLQYYFTCYNLLAQETSNKISKGIQKFAYLLENDFSSQQIIDMINYLNEKLPKKGEFTKSFSLLGWSHVVPAYKSSSDKRRIQIALLTYEYFKFGYIDIADLTIEHIIPDSKGINSLIGNIIPLEDSLNNKCKDKPVLEKLYYYKQSRFGMARQFAEKHENGEFDVNKRAEFMGAEIYDALLEEAKKILNKINR